MLDEDVAQRIVIKASVLTEAIGVPKSENNFFMK